MGKTKIATLKIWLHANLETDMLNTAHKRLKLKGRERCVMLTLTKKRADDPILNEIKQTLRWKCYQR